MTSKHLDPRLAFEDFDRHITLFTVATDSEIEGQYFDRKEIAKPVTGNVPKQAINDIRGQIRETISAFANTNDGLLVIGISKNGRVIGVNHLTEEQLNSLTAVGQLLRNHGAVVSLKDCTDSDGQPNRLLTFYVQECKDDLCLTNEAQPRGWKRVGLQNLPLEERDLNRIRRDKHIENYERRLASPYRPEDVDTALLAEIRQTWLDGPLEARTNEDLLHEFGAVEKDGQADRFTNAGLLFFASNPQRVIAQAHIRILRYETTLNNSQPSEPSLDRTFTGSVTNQLRKVRDFLRESGLIRVYHVRRKDGGFEEQPELPFIVVDEAIVNAVAHRDYGLEWPIECIYYRDALVVKNPGRLLQRNGNVPASFRLDERTLQSTPRNPILLNWLKQSKDQKGQRFVRAISEGTRTMLHEMTEAHLPPPEYTVTDTETIVTLRIDPSRHERTVERASEFTNLYSVTSKSAITGDWRNIALSTLKDRLVAAGWYVDRFAHGRMTAHMRGTAFPLPEAVNKVVQMFPAYTMTFREVQGRYYLVVDYTVEVKSILTLAELERRGYSSVTLEGRRVSAKTQDGWLNGRIEQVAGGSARISLLDASRSETISTNSIIPSLNLREIRQELKDSRFDLHGEVKKRSLASTIASARKRAETTQLTVQGIAEKIFPIKVGSVELALSSEPQRLDSTTGLVPRNLSEPLVEFDRKHETSNIRDGITQYGAYEHPQEEVELIPVVADTHRTAMQGLIERLKGGKFKYKGAERTFGLRFTYSSIVTINPSEGPLETVRRIISEHPTWVGDNRLRRLFLVHVPEVDFALDDATSPYYRTKRFLLEAGVPCQMVDTPTLDNPDWKDLNLALNIAAKSGVVPWVLPEGMPDADFLVGLSYTQHRGDASSRLMGYANVFNRYGRWLFYSGNTHAFEFDQRTPKLAELIEQTLRRVDSLSETPHIYFHYSARFSREDRDALVAAARRVRPKGTYSFVWINSHHPVRLYDERPESDGSLARGSYVVTSPNQFYLSTTGYNPYRKVIGTPVPLEINVWRYTPSGYTQTPPDLHSLARQILALTKLNWASSDALTGEPITTKYAGDIAYLTAAFMRQEGTFKLHKALEQSPWFL